MTSYTRTNRKPDQRPCNPPQPDLAVSLLYNAFSRKRKKDRGQGRKDLLTPFGLRSLSTDHFLYKGQYLRDALTRDTAYHNGTVWPWLPGFVKAYLKTHGYEDSNVEYMKSILEGFDGHLESPGIGGISEVFDGDYPHAPGGTIAQAWSVAEILRAYVEDVLGIKP